MAALGLKARELVQAGRSALRPTDGDRDRIAAALRVQLGPAALPPPGSVAPPPVVAASGWKAVLGTVLGVGATLGALYLAFSPDGNVAPRASHTPPPAVSAVASPPSPPVAPPGEARAPQEELDVAPPAVVAAPATAPSESPALHPRDRLAEEVALLSRATKALRGGRAAEALKALDEHQSKFPRGVLTEERRAARAEALCSLGRTKEGRAELGRLAPQSPAAARATQACDRSSGAAPRAGATPQ
jgi:hypothetical protein